MRHAKGQREGVSWRSQGERRRRVIWPSHSHHRENAVGMHRVERRWEGFARLRRQVGLLIDQGRSSEVALRALTVERLDEIIRWDRERAQSQHSNKPDGMHPPTRPEEGYEQKWTGARDHPHEHVRSNAKGTLERPLLRKPLSVRQAASILEEGGVLRRDALDLPCRRHCSAVLWRRPIRMRCALRGAHSARRFGVQLILTIVF
jgi:hypothetical protein